LTVLYICIVFNAFIVSARDREVLGSIPGQCTARQQLWASC